MSNPQTAADDYLPRRFQSDKVIVDFYAVGEITLKNPDHLDDLIRILRHGMVHVGLGSARRMGYGRGKVISVKKID